MDIQKVKSKQAIPEHAKCVFKGVMFDTYQWEQEMYDGSKVVFEKVKRPDTVVVYPILEDGRILMINDEQPLRDARMCAPGGRVNEGEEIIEAAKRELIEETGYTADKIFLWYATQPVVKIEWGLYIFFAKGLHKAKDQNLDAGERIKLIPVTFDEFIGIVSNSEFNDFDTRSKILEARLDPEKMEELKELFKPL